MKIFNQTFDESCQYKNSVHEIMARWKKKLRHSEETAVISQVIYWLDSIRQSWPWDIYCQMILSCNIVKQFFWVYLGSICYLSCLDSCLQTYVLGKSKQQVSCYNMKKSSFNLCKFGMLSIWVIKLSFF